MPFNRLIQIKGSRQTRLPLLLECLLCRDKFTQEDIEKKRYYIETFICKKCYISGTHTSAKIWCFGKLPKGKLPGFSEENTCCRLLCPDRKICSKFVRKLTRRKNG